MSDYVWTHEMGLMFGSSVNDYEMRCREALFWLLHHTGSAEWKEHCVGIVVPANDAAKRLEEKMAQRFRLSGPMTHVVVAHARFVQDQGWPAYREKMERKARARP